MSSLRERVLRLLKGEDGLTDRQITDRLLGTGAPQQNTNQVCRRLAEQGHLIRRRAGDGLIRNWIGEAPVEAARPAPAADGASEDILKLLLQRWLVDTGWGVSRVAWGKEQGVDIEAVRGDQRWLIEVKGAGSRSAMRVNYFLAALGECLQRMSDPAARYSIALPDLPQFRGLWQRLPEVAKRRTGITCLFVDTRGGVDEAQ